MLLSSTIASLAALAGGVAAWSELDPPASHFHLRDVMQETVRLPLTRRSPTIKRADGSFDLSQMETEMSWVVGKYEANARALHLFGGSEANPDTRMKARTVADLTYVQSGVWSAPIQVGTPPTTYNVYLDTGSSDFTLADVDCSTASCGSKTRYDPSSSSTAVETGETTSSCFVDGTCTTGEVVEDSVTFAGAATVTQSIISASSLSTTVLNIPTDGLMGMAYSSLSSTGKNSTPFSIFGAGGASIFSLKFSDTEGESFVTMGIPPRNSIVNNNFLRFSNVKPYTYWQAASSHANVNGIFASNVSASFIFDCGTTLIVAPPPQAEYFWSKVPGSAKMPGSTNYYTYPCASPPNVTFSPNKFRSSYAMSEASFNLGYLPSDSSRCVGAVVSQNVGLGTSWILGLAFLKNWVTVHDMGYNRFGFGTIRTT